MRSSVHVSASIADILLLGEPSLGADGCPPALLPACGPAGRLLQRLGAWGHPLINAVGFSTGASDQCGGRWDPSG